MNKTSLPRIIICCGMKRSGSTLQFNMVKEILDCGSIEFDNLKYIQGDQLKQIVEERQSSSIALLKCHDMKHVLELDNPKLLLYTLRDPRDAYLSCKIKWGKTIEHLPEIVGEFANSFRYAQTSDGILIQRYEDLFGYKSDAVESISNFLGIKIDSDASSKVINKVSIESHQKSPWLAAAVRARNSARPWLKRFSILRCLTWPLKKLFSTWHHRALERSNTQLHVDHISKNKGMSGMWESQLSNEELTVFETEYASLIDEMGYGPIRS